MLKLYSKLVSCFTVKRNFYVGLRKNRKSLVFKWSDGTSFIETFNESQWMHGQNLFNSTKNCVTLNERHRKFEVTSCISWNAGYICQRQIITGNICDNKFVFVDHSFFSYIF